VDTKSVSHRLKVNFDPVSRYEGKLLRIYDLGTRWSEVNVTHGSNRWENSRYLLDTPNVLVEWLTLLLLIREVQDSKLGPETYPD
jgi:hypothetical protein